MFAYCREKRHVIFMPNVMSPFLVSLMMLLGWVSRVGDNLVMGVIFHYQWAWRVLEEFYGVRWGSLTSFHHQG